MKYDYLVSIIMPAYNSEPYIRDTIKSVIGQSYDNFELIIVDDNSTDNTKEIIEDIAKSCDKIVYFRFNENKGAAEARNKAISMAKGRFIAFLDSDDIWSEDKLKIQVDYMLKNNIHFSFSDYEVISNEGEILKTVQMPHKLSYDGYLRNPIIQTLTVMIDRNYIDDIYMPILKRRQDFACWLKILKKGEMAYSINKVLGKYRRANNSLSSNKIKAVKGTWHVYRSVENLPLIKSLYYFVGYSYNACKKRIYPKKYLKRLGNKI